MESNCYVGFSVSKLKFRVLSDLISMFQKGKSHCFIAFYLESQKTWYAIDSTAAGVKVRRLVDFETHNKIISKYNVDATEEQKVKMINWSLERSYEKYPVIEIIGNAIQIILKLISFGKWKVKNPFGLGASSPRCNELVSLILQDIFTYPNLVDLDSQDLIELEDYLQKRIPK